MNKLNHSHRKTNNMEQMGEDRHEVSFKFFFWRNTSKLSSPSLKKQHGQLSAITDPTVIWLPGDLPGAGVISRVELGPSATSYSPSPFTATQTHTGKKIQNPRKVEMPSDTSTGAKFHRMERLSAQELV